jgi:hypothetical protein
VTRPSSRLHAPVRFRRSPLSSNPSPHCLTVVAGLGRLPPATSSGGNRVEAAPCGNCRFPDQPTGKRCSSEHRGTVGRRGTARTSRIGRGTKSPDLVSLASRPNRACSYQADLRSRPAARSRLVAVHLPVSDRYRWRLPVPSGSGCRRRETNRIAMKVPEQTTPLLGRVIAQVLEQRPDGRIAAWNLFGGTGRRGSLPQSSRKPEEAEHLSGWADDFGRRDGWYPVEAAPEPSPAVMDGPANQRRIPSPEG